MSDEEKQPEPPPMMDYMMVPVDPRVTELISDLFFLFESSLSLISHSAQESGIEFGWEKQKKVEEKFEELKKLGLLDDLPRIEAYERHVIKGTHHLAKAFEILVNWKDAMITEADEIDDEGEELTP